MSKEKLYFLTKFFLSDWVGANKETVLYRSAVHWTVIQMSKIFEEWLLLPEVTELREIATQPYF